MPVAKISIPEFTSITDAFQKEQEFTKWLLDNLDALDEILGLKLSPIDKEVRTDEGFQADIMADSVRGKVIIENQYGNTDHKHLGQILGYMINLEAKIAIWISEEPRPTHREVIQWLNENSPSDMGFYMVSVKAINLSNNHYMPLFSLVEGPTLEARNFAELRKSFSELQLRFEQFWEGFIEENKNYPDVNYFQYKSPSTKTYICTPRDLKPGFRYCCSIIRTRKEAIVEIYIETNDKRENKRLFQELNSNADQIEELFGQQLDWKELPERSASRIIYTFEDIDWEDEKTWPDIYDKLNSGLKWFNNAFKDYIIK